MVLPSFYHDLFVHTDYERTSLRLVARPIIMRPTNNKETHRSAAACVDKLFSSSQNASRCTCQQNNSTYAVGKCEVWLHTMGTNDDRKIHDARQHIPVVFSSKFQHQYSPFYMRTLFLSVPFSSPPPSSTSQITSESRYKIVCW